MIPNPWPQLSVKPPFVLPGDVAMVEEHNAKVGPEHRLAVDIPPEPYTGNPLTAKIVLLNLNPGYAPEDHVFLMDPKNLKRVFAALRHEPQEYAFYHLHPDLVEWTGHGWWAKLFKPVIEMLHVMGVEQPHRRLSENVAAIEWFPYHSKGFKASSAASVAQLYSWHLAQQAVIDSGRLVIAIRALKRWESVLGKLDVPVLARGNPCLSTAQLGAEAFERLIYKLSGKLPVPASYPPISAVTPAGLALQDTVLPNVRNVLNDRHGWMGGSIQGKFLRYKGPGGGTTYSMGFVGDTKTQAELYIRNSKALLAYLERRVAIKEINGTELLWEKLDGKIACRVGTRRDPQPPDATIDNFVADIVAIRGLVHALVKDYCIAAKHGG